MKRITIESWEMYLVTFDVIPPTSIYIFLFFVWSLNPPPCRLWLRNAIQAWRERFKSQHHTEPRLWMDKYCHLEQDSEEFPKPLLRMLYFIILCYFQLPFAFCLAIENVLRSKKCFKALFSQDLSEVWTKKISRTLWQPVCRKDWKLGLTTSGRPKSQKKKSSKKECTDACGSHKHPLSLGFCTMCKACLPIYLASCSKMVVICGESYLTRSGQGRFSTEAWGLMRTFFYLSEFA